MASRTVNMIMVGPSRVGKSSLLATMYREIGKLKSGFDLTPVDETSDRLDEAYQRLNDVMSQRIFAPIEDLLKGTQDFIEHHFEVGFQGTKKFDLVFHDIRGGVMLKRTDPDWEELCQKVAASHVIFNVLDAVALMEADPIKNDTLFNCHTRTCELLTKTLQPEEKYLIVFVLVKSETYVKKDSTHDRLMNRFEERHSAVLRLIERLNEQHKNVAALVIPVITLGCVEFKEIDQDGNFIFERINKNFQPRDVDQPLRYALSFALNHVNEKRGIIEAFIDWWTGKGKAFGQALKDFCNHRSNDFKKYGNPSLLEVK
jgi:hypothetical protein